MSDTDAELTFDDDLDWLGNDSPWHAVDGTAFGSFEPLVRALPRLLMDGENVEHDRDGNRVLPIRLECAGDDLLALAEAEADLRKRLRRRSTLRWKPPGLNTPVSVFDTFACVEFAQEFSDLDELSNVRYFRLSLPASPHVHSENAITADLELGRRLVTDSTRAALWTPGTDLTLSTSNGILIGSKSSTTYDGVSLYSAAATMTFTERVGLDVGRYVSIAVKDMPGYAAPVAMKAAAVGYALTSSVASVADPVLSGYTRHYFGPMPAGMLEDLTFTSTVTKAGVIATPVEFRWGDVYVEATLPADDAGFAQYGQVDVLGSERTPATVTIESASELGAVQVFVCQARNGFRPDLTDYQTAADGTYTSDATKVSGGFYTGGDITYRVPAVSLRPVGYHVVAHVNYPDTDPVTHSVTAQLFPASGSALSESYETLKRVSPAAAGWQLSTLGTFYPPGEVGDNSTNEVELVVSAADVSIDEVWLIPMDGSMLQVKAATDVTRVRIIAPDPDYPQGAVFMGSDDADERNALGYVLGSPQLSFEPGVNMLHVVTTGAEAADVGVTYYPRWSHNAAL